MGLFDNPNGNPSTSLGIGMSTSPPNFNIALELKFPSWTQQMNLLLWNNSTLGTFLNNMNPYTPPSNSQSSRTPLNTNLPLDVNQPLDANTPQNPTISLAEIDYLTGANINYGQLFMNAGFLLGGLLAYSLGGLAGLIAGLAMNSAGTAINSISNLRSLNAASKAGVLGLEKAKAGNAMAIAGAASDLIGSFMPEKTEYNGPKGDITRTMDSVYDGISDAAMAFGPVGMMVGGIMKGGKLLRQGVNALGGGTDGMTTTDAILGSSFLNLTPIGLINGFGGKKAETITKDETAFETVGASYTGSNQSVNSALLKSGKKYGLLSSGARKKANEEILEARRQLAIISEIADESSDRFAIRNSMSAINGNRRSLAMRGGYDPMAIRVGKYGLDLKTLSKAREITSKYNQKVLEFLKGGTLQDPFIVYLNSLPEYLRDSTNYRVRDYWEFNGRPKNFGEAIAKGMFTIQDDGWHANSVLENPTTGEIEFMKSDSHPSHQKEIDWYNSDEGADFRNKYELIKSSPYLKYVKRGVQEYKEGGALSILVGIDPEDLVEEFKQGGTIQETSLIMAVDPDDIQEYKEGGAFNVIPEGALHARKHNMENAENLTKKGIPVVVEKEDGELEQLAEIEREEIIFRLAVTKKLEELAKDGSDESAIEAGKILVEEILNNTIDNTNRLL